jgi:hypothetical protein
MPVLNYLRQRLRLPRRIALIFGIGAISAVSANADGPAPDTSTPIRIPQQSAKAFGELRVWSNDGRIYLSESGGPAQELALGDTAEALHLRRLLEDGGAVADDPQVLEHRIILVGGGGAGLHWAPGDKAPGSAAHTTGPASGAGDRDHRGSADRTRPADANNPGTQNPTTGGHKG